MKTVTQILVLPLLALFLGACASEQTVTKTQVRTDWRGKTVPFTVGKDEDGNPVMKSERRSSLEGRQSNIAGSNYAGKDYDKKSYGKKSWFGNTIFGKKKYQGNTDANKYKSEPWFVRKQASASNTRSRADGKSYSVNPFRTGSARERSASTIRRTPDAETSVRRRVYRQPDITHWKDQPGLTVKDTNRMLGR